MSADPTLKVDRLLLSDHVHIKLRESILSGDYTPGSRLVETETARRFGVSQAPVRDAFRKLVSAGLATHEPHRGTFVAGISTKAAVDAYHVRVALEPLAAKELLTSVNPETLEELGGIVAAMVECAASGDLEGLMRHDIAFHRIIWWRCGNELLPKVWPMVEKIWPLLETRVRSAADQDKRFFYKSLHEVALTHEPLVQALATADPRTPEMFLEHVTTVWSRVESLGKS